MIRQALCTGLVSTALCVSFAFPAAARTWSDHLDDISMRGHRHVAECVNETQGLLDNLIAARLERKLEISGHLTREERDIWRGYIEALEQVSPDNPFFAPPDWDNQYRYMRGLSALELAALDSLFQRVRSEHARRCMDQFLPEALSSRIRDAASLRGMRVEPIDVDSLPVEPLPRPEASTEADVLAEFGLAETRQRNALISANASCLDARLQFAVTNQADELARIINTSDGLTGAQLEERFRHLAETGMRNGAAQLPEEALARLPPELAEQLRPRREAGGIAAPVTREGAAANAGAPGELEVFEPIYPISTRIETNMPEIIDEAAAAGMSVRFRVSEAAQPQPGFYCQR